tara:strand:- start:2074 stop:2967 length:894 start_codon:yes stop_codon:yes gene_type:complete
MISVNSISGGQTSAYIATKYPSDYNVFSLVRIEGKRTIKDKKVIQYIEDRIQKPFIATAEDDIIIRTMIDLEQYIGKKIHWVSGDTFDEHLRYNNGNVPNLMRRTCTINLKLKPMFEWWQKTINEVVEMRIGFRANELGRKAGQDKRLNKDGYLEFKHVIGKHESGRNKWGTTAWQKPRYPLIEDNILKDTIQKFWSDKPVKFAPINNCVGCFHQNIPLLRKRFDWFPEKMDWFISKEGNKNIIKKTEKNKGNTNRWRAGIDELYYTDVKKMFRQNSLFDELTDKDFTECDSGYCGL